MEPGNNYEDEIVVIGAGLARTGTFTLKHVLHDLLGKPCYHMHDAVWNPPSHMEFWASALKGEKKSKEEWRNILKGYGAGVDVPFCLFYKELMVGGKNILHITDKKDGPQQEEIYPNARVLLSVRDPQKWYESVTGSINRVVKFLNTWRGHLCCTIMMPRKRKLPEFMKACHSVFLGDNWEEDNKEDYIYHYRKHVEEVKRNVPEDKLLIFNVREGYEPLCKFLGVPMREGSLPRMNDTESVMKGLFAMKVVGTVIAIGLPVILIGCMWVISSYLKLI